MANPADKRIKSVQSRKVVATQCSKETERCSIAVLYSHPLPVCCRAHTVAMMAGMQRVLDAAGVTWWIDYGSLLGAVRNPLLGQKPGIIAHDKDGDCGILADDMPKVLGALGIAGEGDGRNVSVMYDFGGGAGICWVTYKLPRGNNEFNCGDSVKVRWSAVNHSNVDFFFWHRKDDTLYRKRYIPADRFKGREFPADRLLPLTALPWEGLTVPAPADPVWFCAHRYGANWRTPILRNHDGVKR